MLTDISSVHLQLVIGCLPAKDSEDGTGLETKKTIVITTEFEEP